MTRVAYRLETRRRRNIHLRTGALRCRGFWLRPYLSSRPRRWVAYPAMNALSTLQDTGRGL
jgi:hypothetical protein